MHPVLKRILVNGGLTAVILALVGLLFSELGGMWASAPGRPGATNPGQTGAALRTRVPLMMALWGFAFVVVCELVLYRIRRRAPAKPADPVPDDAEKLLNELLAQAEAKMAAEAEGKRAEDREQRTEGGERTAEKAEAKPEGSGQKAEAGHRSDGGEGARPGSSVL
jgi:hypothetical protein